MRCSLAFLLPLALPLPATAQTLAVNYQTSPERGLGYDPAPAQDSFAALLRTTFAADGTGSETFGVSVLVSPDLTSDCPGGTIEPMRGIRVLASGLFAGWVVPTAMSSQSHLFGETFTISPSQIWDWQLPSQEDDGRLYGAYRLRWT